MPERRPTKSQAKPAELLCAEETGFIPLVERAGLDPGEDFRFQDLTNVDLRGLDLTANGALLRPFIFCNAVLAGADLRGTRFAPGALEGADLTGAVLGGTTVGGKPMEPINMPTGWVFRDHPDAPEMVVIQGGTFLMGSPEDEPGRQTNEAQKEVTLGPYAIGRYVVTVEEYERKRLGAEVYGVLQKYVDSDREIDTRKKLRIFRRARRARKQLRISQREYAKLVGNVKALEEKRRMLNERVRDLGPNPWRLPVVNLIFERVREYADWLRDLTGQPYTLPTESRWEFACRAGTTTAYSFGDTITKTQANFDAQRAMGADNLKKTAPPFRTDAQLQARKKQQLRNVGSYPANPWGMYDMHGNVEEYCVGSTQTVAAAVRGGSWRSPANQTRSAFRNANFVLGEDFDRGFRVARTLIP